MQGDAFAPQQQQQQAPPAYGHPVTAFFHVFFKVGAWQTNSLAITQHASSVALHACRWQR